MKLLLLTKYKQVLMFTGKYNCNALSFLILKLNTNIDKFAVHESCVCTNRVTMEVLVVKKCS